MEKHIRINLLVKCSVLFVTTNAIGAVVKLLREHRSQRQDFYNINFQRESTVRLAAL